MLLAESNSVRYSSTSVRQTALTHSAILAETHVERRNPERVRSAASGQVHDSPLQSCRAKKLNKGREKWT